MKPLLLGLHHVTAIVGDPQRNVDFYAGLLGLRLVKQTVNFDDPGTYHLYFGDDQGQPGTIVTFFPWGDAHPGRLGSGQVSTMAFAIPEQAVPFWLERLRTHGVEFQGPTPRLNEHVIAFQDHDGLQLELVTSADSRQGASAADIAPEHAITGLHSVALLVDGAARTAAALTEVLGFHEVASEGNRTRYALADGAPGTLVDVIADPSSYRGAMGVGTVHHVAWRTPDDANEVGWLQTLREQRFNVSPVMDRNYFHSIYFREPGGVLFEIATDPPGFAVDEPADQLGTSLKLPAQYEHTRAELELKLPKLQLPINA